MHRYVHSKLCFPAFLALKNMNPFWCSGKLRREQNSLFLTTKTAQYREVVLEFERTRLPMNATSKLRERERGGRTSRKNKEVRIDVCVKLHSDTERNSVCHEVRC